MSSESLRPTPFGVSSLPPLSLSRVLVIKIYIRKQQGDRGRTIASRVESPGKYEGSREEGWRTARYK